MDGQYLLDPIPLALVFVLLVLGAAGNYVLGYRFGQWWIRRNPDNREDHAGQVVASVLAMVAFLVGITAGMAGDRFETRTALVIDEANAISSFYRRASLVPDPLGSELRSTLRQYIDTRISATDTQVLLANTTRSGEILEQLWTRLGVEARTNPEAISGLIDALGEADSTERRRVNAIVEERVPEELLFVVLLGAAFSLVIVGFGNGQVGKPNPISAAILMLLLGVVLTAIIDLDRSREGLLQVSQQPLIEVRGSMH